MKSRFDISRTRFHPVWLIVGALIGRGLGLVGGLNFAFWYYSDPGAVLGWQIFGAIAGAIFCSFLMTSKSTPQLKGAILGLGIGFALACYIGETWSHVAPDRTPANLVTMSFGEGIVYEWTYMHASWLGLIIGWITGAIISRRTQTIPEPRA